ncbi:MAG: tRNA (N(6)-L-threonylcarbamoyladenosine(37)-C(2))-methylthiotransferase MtaB [Thermodesulfobacteriota bacterium]
MAIFFIQTLGCKVNQFESDALRTLLMNNGWVPAGDGQPAEVCIINTCTVTRKASMQSRQAIRQAIRLHPDARIIVTGCYAQTAPEEIEQIQGVYEIIGHAYKHKIADAILSKRNKKIPKTPLRIIRDINREQIFKQTPVVPVTDRTRPYLKIQDGCSSFCSYCIVPFARGRSRSMPREDVLANITSLASFGYQEVVLTGIDLGSYGKDLSGKNGGLAELLFHIESRRLIQRVRLSSIEPLEFSNDLFQLIAESRMICRHFHIPLQSGDDGILKKMRRPYTSSQYARIIEELHRLAPHAAIGADVLVGFPGETDSAFENTMSLVKALPLTYLHVFPYSVRPGTAACEFPGRLEADIIKVRCRLIRELGLWKKRRFYQNAVGSEVEILIEDQREPLTSRLKGLSSNYIPVLLDGPDDLKNTIQSVRLEKVEPGDILSGAILKQPAAVSRSTP